MDLEDKFELYGLDLKFQILETHRESKFSQFSRFYKDKVRTVCKVKNLEILIQFSNNNLRFA